MCTSRRSSGTPAHDVTYTHAASGATVRVMEDADATTDAGRITLGASLRTRRLSKGLLIRDIADRTGTTVAHVSDVERGRRSPSLELLLAWATVLNTSVRDVMAGAYPWDSRAQTPRNLTPPPDGRQSPSRTVGPVED